jgi:hypothetical protein
VLQQTRTLRLPPGGAPAPPLPAPGEDLLERPDVVALYIRLLCQYEPGQVLAFLQGHQNYDVRACIRCGPLWGARGARLGAAGCRARLTGCRAAGVLGRAGLRRAGPRTQTVVGLSPDCPKAENSPPPPGPPPPTHPGRHCKAHGVADAEAFLHERLGDMEAALRLYLADVGASWARLEAALLEGRVQVLARQAPGRASRGSDPGSAGRQGGSALGGFGARGRPPQEGAGAVDAPGRWPPGPCEGGGAGAAACHVSCGS